MDANSTASGYDPSATDANATGITTNATLPAPADIDPLIPTGQSETVAPNTTAPVGNVTVLDEDKAGVEGAIKDADSVDNFNPTTGIWTNSTSNATANATAGSGITEPAPVTGITNATLANSTMGAGTAPTGQVTWNVRGEKNW
jgi:hypothetical protein